jgi:hypothetical protein
VFEFDTAARTDKSVGDSARSQGGAACYRDGRLTAGSGAEGE